VFSPLYTTDLMVSINVNYDVSFLAKGFLCKPKMFLNTEFIPTYPSHRIRKIIVSCLFLLQSNVLLFSQEPQRDVQPLSRSFLTEFLHYLSEDTYVFGGLNAFNLLYSNQFRDLDFGWGYNLGVIGYTPLQKKSYLNIGLQIQYVRFHHKTQNFDEWPQFFKAGIPLYVSYDLPSPPKSQVKIQFGTQVDYIFFAGKNSTTMPQEAEFRFDLNQLKRFHFNYRIGFQMEYSPLILEVFYVHSLNKMFQNDIGVPNQFCLNIGYFFKRYPQIKAK
jgi:hypothetical protein